MVRVRLLPLPTDEDDRPVVRFREEADVDVDAPLKPSFGPLPRGRILRRRLLPERLVSSAAPTSVPLAQNALRRVDERERRSWMLLLLVLV